MPESTSAGPEGLRGTSPVFLPGLRQASAKACSLPHRPPSSQIRRKSKGAPLRPFFLPAEPGTKGARGAAAPLCLGDFVYCAHFTSTGATQLRSCLIAVANNGGWPSPRLLISQVPLLGMCLSLRVPVAAWKWTEARRVTKRGSPCARGSQRLPDCVRAISEAIADDRMNHSEHTWLLLGTVLPHAAAESGASRNESAAADPRAVGGGWGAHYAFPKYWGVASGVWVRGLWRPTLWFFRLTQRTSLTHLSPPPRTL